MEAPLTSDRASAQGEERVSDRGAGRPVRGFLLLLGGLVVSAAAMALRRVPHLVEDAYADGVGPTIAWGLSRATGWIPFSLGAFLGLALLAFVARKAVRGIRRLRSGEPGRRVLLEGAEWASGLAGVLLVLFYPLWGLNYARAPLEARLAMTLDERLGAVELVALTTVAAHRTNEAYRTLHEGREDVGGATDGFVDRVATSQALEVGWARVAGPLDLGPVATRRYGPVKTLGVTTLIDLLDIAGLYIPYTGEANVSGAQPDLSFPAVAAHEQAHQRGIARENAATFAGVLAAIHTEDPMARYSGWARILRSLQSDLVRTDGEAWAEIRSTLHPGVVRDWRDYLEYLRESRSVAAPIVEATNDAYLRAHGVPGGIESYGRVTTLLVEWARRHDGQLTLDPTP